MTIASNVSATITAQNTFTDWLQVSKGRRFSLDIYGTFVANVYLQKTYDGGLTIIDDPTVRTAPYSEISLPMPEGTQYRIGVKTGGFTSGTVNVRLGTDN